MGIMDFLLSIARSVIRGVMSIINQQINLIMDQVTQPLKSFIQQVVGGIWKGDGATRFVEEMNSDVIPALTHIADIGANFGSLIGKAVDIFDQADAKAGQLANSLFDVFNNILSF
jgi:phage-related protein